MASRECRICGTASNLISVFQIVDGESMCDKIKMIAEVRISKEDNLPKFVCIGCIGKVNKCVGIKRQIEFSHKIFYSPTEINEQNEAVDENVGSDHCDALKTSDHSSEDSIINEIDPGEQSIPFDLIDRTPSPIPCERCGVFSPTVTTWKAHMRTHSKGEWKCHNCGKILYSQISFMKHVRRHTGEKPFHCSTCGKRFFAKANLKDHERRHTGDRPYPCLICENKYKGYQAMITHMRLQHSNDVNQVFK